MEFELDIILLGQRLRSFRKSTGMTMKEFSELCSISERYLANIERGQQAPKLETFARIANVTGVSPDYLLRDSLPGVRNGDVGAEIQDVINTFTPEQQNILRTFIIQLASSIK